MAQNQPFDVFWGIKIPVVFWGLSWCNFHLACSWSTLCFAPKTWSISSSTAWIHAVFGGGQNSHITGIRNAQLVVLGKLVIFLFGEIVMPFPMIFFEDLQWPQGCKPKAKSSSLGNVSSSPALWLCEFNFCLLLHGSKSKPKSIYPVKPEAWIL